MEIPVRRLLLGADPAAVADPNAMADPAALTDFVEYARTQRDYTAALTRPALAHLPHRPDRSTP